MVYQAGQSHELDGAKCSVDTASRESQQILQDSSTQRGVSRQGQVRDTTKHKAVLIQSAANLGRHCEVAAHSVVLRQGQVSTAMEQDAAFTHQLRRHSRVRDMHSCRV
jgi:hypothetical protein